MSTRSRFGIIGAAAVAAVALALPAAASQARPAVPAVTHNETSYVRTVVVTAAVAASPAVVAVPAVVRSLHIYSRTVVVTAAVPGTPAVGAVTRTVTSDWSLASPHAGWVAGAPRDFVIQEAVTRDDVLWAGADEVPGDEYASTGVSLVVPADTKTQWFVRDYYGMTYTYVWAVTQPAGGTVSTSPADPDESTRVFPAHTEYKYVAPVTQPAVTEARYQWTGTVIDAAVPAIPEIPAVTRAEVTGFVAQAPLGDAWVPREVRVVEVTPAVVAADAVSAVAAVTRVESSGWVHAVPAGDGWTVAHTRSVTDSPAVAAVRSGAVAALSATGASGWVPLLAFALGLGLVGASLRVRAARSRQG